MIMSNFLISLIAGAAAAGWVYNKFMKTTGGNTKNSIGGAIVAGILAFLSLFVLISFIS